MVLRAELGLRSPVTWAAILFVDLVPVTIGWGLAMGPSDAVRGRLLNVLLAMASAAATVAALELAVRVAGYDQGSGGGGRKYVGDKPFTDRGTSNSRLRMQPLSRWGHEYSSNDRGYFGRDNTVVYSINSAGYRGDEFTKSKEPGRVRIALLGDSFGFGEGVRYEDTVASRLESLLGPCSLSGVEVYNFSVPAYATSDEADLLESEVMDYDPDIVIVWYFLNDTEVAGTMQFLGASDEQVFFPAARRFSALARLAGGRLDAWLMAHHMIRRYHQSYEPGDERWSKVTAALGRVAGQCRESGVACALFIHPILYRLDESYPFADLHGSVAAASRNVGLPAYDLLEAFRGWRAEDLWVHPGDQHPNEVGHRIAAEFAAAQLGPLIPGCR